MWNVIIQQIRLKQVVNKWRAGIDWNLLKGLRGEDRVRGGDRGVRVCVCVCVCVCGGGGGGGGGRGGVRIGWEEGIGACVCVCVWGGGGCRWATAISLRYISIQGIHVSKCFQCNWLYQIYSNITQKPNGSVSTKPTNIESAVVFRLYSILFSEFSVFPAVTNHCLCRHLIPAEMGRPYNRKRKTAWNGQFKLVAFWCFYEIQDTSGSKKQTDGQADLLMKSTYRTLIFMVNDIHF